MWHTARLVACLVSTAVATTLLTPSAGASATDRQVAAADPSGDRFALTTTRPGGPGFAPAFVGNGYLAGRQPADGQGFAKVSLPGSDEPLPTQSEVHGFYAEVSEPDTGLIERRAALPAWSTLRYNDGSGVYSLDRGKVRNYRQSLHLLTGTLTTTLVWTSPAGRTARLRYDVTPDRARRHAALVRLTVVPRFSGRIRVTDVLDGRAADLTKPAGVQHRSGTQSVDLRSKGLGVRATVASILDGPGNAVRPVSQPDSQSSAQRMVVDARAQRPYVFTKSVGIAVSTDGERGSAHDRAVRAAKRESALGYRESRDSSDAAWSALWSSDVRVRGDQRLQRQVRAAYFSLLASIRADTPWAPSPGGLSSDGYNGHVFWDSETWMYPTMLATHPAMARAMLKYRFDRLRAARRNAKLTGYDGARYPWESALSGGEDTPSCCLTGKLEVHISADIALAAWQYWLATGDRKWLEQRGWPMLRGIANFWVSRSERNKDGSRSIANVIPPDEYAEHVDDSIYTNVGARDSLRIAVRAARLVDKEARPPWQRVAKDLRILPLRRGVHPEYAGYPGDTIKQGDVTLLTYPWENDQSRAVSQRDLDYYVPRTDPNGPSMTDAIHSIVTSQLGTPGCSAYTFTRRSVDPFMRGPYAQFSEARTGGAFTFTTGAGGFLQEFLYGYSGLRWRAGHLQLDPSLPPQLTGVTLRAVHWRGRVLKIDMRRDVTRVMLRSGPALPVASSGAAEMLEPGNTISLSTRTPDTKPTGDLARCGSVGARPSTTEPAEAAVDGTDSSTWLADKPGVALTTDLGRVRTPRRVVITRPPVLAIASTVLFGEAETSPTDSAGERIRISADGQKWTTIARIANPDLRDEVAVRGKRVRYVRINSLDDARPKHPLVVGQLKVRS